MKFEKSEYLSFLPEWIRKAVVQAGSNNLNEIRLRINSPPELILGNQRIWLDRKIRQEEINFCVNTASKYSPWTQTSVTSGYITTSEGHRIGLCGETVCKNGMITGYSFLSSICIRIAKDLPEISKDLYQLKGSTIILGAPGWGKTSLLRDLSRKVSENETVIVIDERKELFPNGFRRGKSMDVLQGCNKEKGIEMVLRTMGPNCIAVDEITAQEDANSLKQAIGCGVRILATAHAISVNDLQTRPIYRPLWELSLFQNAVILSANKQFHVERLAA